MKKLQEKFKEVPAENIDGIVKQQMDNYMKYHDKAMELNLDREKDSIMTKNTMLSNGRQRNNS